MLLLPPSETKRDGGDDGKLDFGRLSAPRLTARRRAAVRAVRSLAGNAAAMADALKLGRTQTREIERNARVASSPTMPALDRYTGVLYDALDAASLPPAARERAAFMLRIHSALFGLIGGLDPIPAYRLSHDSRLPGLPLKAHWAAAVTRELERHDGLLLDLRSEGYVALGPAPRRPDSVYLRVLGSGPGGAVRALTHFNKHAKGELARALLTAPELPETVADLLEWAPSAGFDLSRLSETELALHV